MWKSTPTPSRYARHLSPTFVGERKGAKPCGRRFLSPVERGRGGLRSKTEWGSTSICDSPPLAGGESDFQWPSDQAQDLPQGARRYAVAI
jgi:hypothetical protein